MRFANQKALIIIFYSYLWGNINRVSVMKIKQLVVTLSLYLISAFALMGYGIAIADFRCAENDLNFEWYHFIIV